MQGSSVEPVVPSATVEVESVPPLVAASVVSDELAAPDDVEFVAALVVASVIASPDDAEADSDVIVGASLKHAPGPMPRTPRAASDRP